MSKVFQVAFEIAGKMGASFHSTFSSVTSQLNTMGAQSVALRSNLKTLDGAYREGVINLESYRNAQSKLKAQLDQTQIAQARLKTAQAEQNETARRASDIRGRMMDTAAMAAPLVLATKAAINFETAMGDVAKQVNDARDANGNLTDVYFQMRTNVMQLSNALRVPPSQIAAITAAAARMGVQGVDALNEFVKMSVEMGVAFEGNGEQIAESMAKIANIRGIKLDTSEGREQLRDLADTINYLDDQSVAKGPEIIEVMQRISGTAAQSSFAHGELAALATTMLSLGKTPEIAATGLNALMNRLATAPSQSKPFQVALEQLNISAKELQQSYMSDSKNTIFGLLEKINTLDKPQQAEILTGLFGAEYQDDISALAAGIDTLKDSFSQLDAEARKGSMDKEFQAKMKLASSAIEGTKAAVERLSISLATGLLPGINSMALHLATAGQWIADLHTKFPALTDGIVMTATGLVGFRLAWLSAKFVMNQWKSTATDIKMILASQRAELAIHRTQMLLTSGATKATAAAQWLFNASLYGCPVMWIVAGIGAVVAAGYLLYKNWDTISAKGSQVWGGITAWFGRTYNAGVLFMQTLPTTIQNGMNYAAQRVVYGIGYMVGYVGTLPSRVRVFAVNTAVALYTEIDSGITTTKQYIASGITYMVGYISALPGQAYVYATATATSMKTAIGNGVNATVQFFVNLPSNAAAALGSFIVTIEEWGANVYNSVVGWIGRIPSAISNAISSARSYVSSVINGYSSNYSAGLEAGTFPGHATGGIFNQEHLAWFAENNKPEAVVPLDGSARSLSIWQKAGDMLGVGGGAVFQITFAPVIHGSNKEEILPELQQQQDSFMEQLQDVFHQQGRVNFSG